MVVHVRDVLEVPSLAGARLVCGEGGLARVVRRVSAINTPTSPDDDALSAAGDLYLTGLYAVSSHPEEIAAYMEDFVRTAAAAVVVIDEFVPRLPPSVLRRCDAADLPVLMLDRHVPYAAVIAEVMELVLLDRQAALDTQRVAVVRDPAQPVAVRVQALRELAPGLDDLVTAVLVTGRGARALAANPEARRERRLATHVGLQDEVLVPVGGDGEDSAGGAGGAGGTSGTSGTSGASGAPGTSTVRHVVAALRSAAPDARVGVSTPALPVASAGRAIEEARLAATGARVLGRQWRTTPTSAPCGWSSRCRTTPSWRRWSTRSWAPCASATGPVATRRCCPPCRPTSGTAAASRRRLGPASCTTTRCATG